MEILKIIKMTEKQKNNIMNEEDNEEYKPVLAVIDDIPQIKSLGASFWGKEGIYSDKFYMEALKQNLSYAYKEKIKNKNILIAICLVRYDKENDVVGIDLLCVKEMYQGMGFGKALLSFCINKCLENCYNKFYLHVATTNYKAISLYKKLGFSIVKLVKNYYYNDKPPDNDAYYMTLYKHKKIEEFKPKINKSKEKEEIKKEEKEKTSNIEEKSRTNHNFHLNENNNNNKKREYNNNFNNNDNYNNGYYYYDYYNNNYYNYYYDNNRDDKPYDNHYNNSGFYNSDYRNGYHKRLNHHFSH